MTYITLAAWVYETARSSGAAIVTKPISNGAYKDPFVSWGIYMESGTNEGPQFRIGNPTQTREVGADIQPLNTWRHILATYDGAQITIWVNAAYVIKVWSGATLRLGYPSYNTNVTVGCRSSTDVGSCLVDSL